MKGAVSKVGMDWLFKGMGGDLRPGQQQLAPTRGDTCYR